MTPDWIRGLYQEAGDLRCAGVFSWANRLLASGLDPHTPPWAARSLVEPSVDEPTAMLGVDDTVAALKRELADSPELWLSTRTQHRDDEVYGRRSADVESFDEASNTIECTWTTGAAVLRLDCSGLYYEALDVTSAAVRLGRLNAGAPFLNSHRSDDLDEVIGAVARGSAKIAGGKGVCRIVLSKAEGCADTIGNIKAGIIRNVSVGYIIHASAWSDETAGLPTCRVTDWEPIEISAVAIPADAGAQLREQPSALRFPARKSLPTLRSPEARATRARMEARARAAGVYR